MDLPKGLDDIAVRAYFAAVVGAFRAPFGNRAFLKFNGVGESRQLVQNATRDKVLAVTVSRSDLLAGAVNVIFSQQVGGGSNDFSASFGATNVFRFVLKPEESVSMQITPGALTAANITVGSEAW